MSFRFLDQCPVYLDASGQPCAGGSLSFFDTGTTNPRAIYADKALTIPAPNPLPLNSQGRTTMDVWGSGSYRVVLKDADGVEVWPFPLDNVDELLTGNGLPNPTGKAGYFLWSPDGVNYELIAIRQLPNPSGSAGKYVYTADGVNYTLRNKNLVPASASVTSSGSVSPDVNSEMTVITAQAAPLTIANPSGTWGQGQMHVLRIKDNGTARALTWDTKYRALGVTLPTTTVISKTLYVGFIYNSTDDKWDVTGVNQEA